MECQAGIGIASKTLGPFLVNSQYLPCSTVTSCVIFILTQRKVTMSKLTSLLHSAVLLVAVRNQAVHVMY